MYPGLILWTFSIIVIRRKSKESIQRFVANGLAATNLSYWFIMAAFWKLYSAFTPISLRNEFQRIFMVGQKIFLFTFQWWSHRQDKCIKILAINSKDPVRIENDVNESFDIILSWYPAIVGIQLLYCYIACFLPIIAEWCIPLSPSCLFYIIHNLNSCWPPTPNYLIILLWFIFKLFNIFENMKILSGSGMRI